MSATPHLVLARFLLDCGRMGSLNGMFVVEKARLEAAYGSMLCFSEVLGKHSYIEVTFAPEHITIVSGDQAFLAEIVEKVGMTLGGQNPLDYVQAPEEDEG